MTLGIGATTAIFSVVDAVVLRGLPFDEHDRLVAIGETTNGSSGVGSNVSPQNYTDWFAQQHAFASMAAIASGWFTLHDRSGEPESVVPQRVTAQFFDVLRVHPAIGRGFTADNEVNGRHRVVVLSDGFWRRRFAADRSIVGQTIRLEDVEGDTGSFEVLGVMPARFTYPVGAARATDVWVPYVVPATQRARSLTSRVMYLKVIARLNAGESVAKAQAQMDGLAAALQRANPEWNKNSGISVRPLADAVVGAGMRGWMLMLLGAVGLVLLIACANVANLLLARAASRTREMGIRAALGASRWRLARQSMVESVLLSTIATACAVVVGWWAADLLKQAMPPSVPRVASIALNLRVLAASALLALVTGLSFGAAPALLLSKPDLTRSLRDGAHGTVSRRRQRLRSTLVVVEIALAVVLLIGAALFIGSFASLMRVDPGFKPHDVLTAQIAPRVERVGNTYLDRSASLEEAVEQISRVPGVVVASMVAGGLPFGGGTTSRTIRAVDGVSVFQQIDLRQVTADYHRALEIPLRAGRLFEPTDRRDSPPVIILNESAARRYFPHASAIGHVMSLDTDRTVVGVVGDVHQRSLEQGPWAEAYVPMAQSQVTGAEIAVRTEGDPIARLPAIRTAAFRALPDVPLRNVERMDDLIGRQVAQRRLNMLLLGLFGLLGLVIAMVGIYAVMAHSVAQRTAEIGVRLALGATPGSVLAMVLRHACLLILTGMAIGGLAAWYLSAAAASFLYEVRPTEPGAYAAALALLAATALLASLVPARRAAHVDPIVALRG
jgi:putative ABC transport system permease protein